MPDLIEQTNQERKKYPVEVEPLCWLYVAHFSDGTIIEQPTKDEEDVSVTRGDGTGNRFTDILAREDELVFFELLHTNGKESVGVDLKNGSFIVNGTPLHAHDQFFEPGKHELRLAYWRENRVDNNVHSEVLENGEVTQETVGVKLYTNRYFIGWQTTVKKKNKQVTLAVG